MAISFVAAGSTVAGPNPTVPVPAGYAAGDLFILFVAAGIVTTPTGWTLLAGTTLGTATQIYYKGANASESSVSVSVANAATLSGMVAYRGVNTFDVQMASFNTSASATSLATSSITTTQTNDYVISYYANGTGVNTWGSAPASTTSRVSVNSTATIRGVLLVDEVQASAGATTARTATITSSSTLSAFSFAIKETTAATVNSNFFLLML
jgi:hypothetical protein